MAYILVDDPDWKGKPPVPQILRTWAMRKLAAQGMTTGDVSRFYGVPFAAAYRAINPERKTRRKAKARADIRTQKTSTLLSWEATKSRRPLDLERAQAASVELDRREVTEDGQGRPR